MSNVSVRPRLRRLVGAVALALPFVVSGASPLPAATKHEFQVSAHKYAYRVVGGDRAELRVREGEVVHIVFAADDIPHSFTVDAPYRIDKRASPGKPVTFDFLADKPGTFEFYCNLALDDRCRKELRGTLIVDPR